MSSRDNSETYGEVESEGFQLFDPFKTIFDRIFMNRIQWKHFSDF